MNFRDPRWSKILTIAWPLIVANSFWNIQLTIDRVFLGMYSIEALGAAMAVVGVFWVPMALLQQTSSYVTTFIAQYYGAKQFSKIGGSFWQSIYVSVFGGLGFLLLNLLSPWFFGWVGHSDTIRSHEISYFNSISFSALPTALVAAVSGFYAGLGKTRTVIGINLIGLILNAILDYLLIFGKFGFPAMGIAGAGIATALAAYGAAFFGLILVFSSENELLYKVRTEWRLKFSLVKEFLKYGVPSGMQWALEGLAFTVLMILMGHLKNGEAALASSSIAMTIMMLSVLPAMGVGQAVMTLVGQYLGERSPEKAEQATWDGVFISSVYMVCVAATFFLFPEFYLSWFQNKNNLALWSEVSAIVPTLLKIVAIFTIFDCLYFNISFALKGAGDTKFVSIVALVIPWPLMVIPAYFVRDLDHAVVWAWMFSALYALATSAILIKRFRGGKWKTMSVIHN